MSVMYQPEPKILDKYADVLIRFALDSCKGIKKGDVVMISVPECAKPMLAALRRSVLKAGGHPMIQYHPDGMAREFYELATDDQLKFFASSFLKGKVDQIDHTVSIIAETDKNELEGVDPKRIMMRQKVHKPYMEWLDEKENAGKFTWTLALYGTPEMAAEVGMSLEEYWAEIIKACYLDEEDPVAKWKATIAEIDRVKERLNAMPIDKLHIEAEGTDLWIGIDENRHWLGGRGRNIPSFEIYISPDWRRTEGYIQFTEPVYIHDNLVEDVYLRFENGCVIESRASKGEAVLKEMIATENANKAGEFSLTDARLSRITKFMGETLFDENVGGRYGNTHLALGKAYQDSFPGDVAAVSKEEWENMGFNDSVVHTDIVATSDRTVTAHLKEGTTKVIYADGKFQV